MRENRNLNIEKLILIVFLMTVLIGFLFVAGDLLVFAVKGIIREQRFIQGFQNQAEEIVIRYTFAENGSLKVEHGDGSMFVFAPPKFQPDVPYSVVLSENETCVNQHFFGNGTDKKGKVQTLNLDVCYDFSIARNKAKISLIGNTTDPDSEIEYEFENPKGAPIQNTTTSYQIGNIVYDWDDLVGATQFIFALNKLKIKFGLKFNLDPSIVSTAQNEKATAYYYQRKIGYANNRWYVFYSEINQMVRSSTDGATWTAGSNVLYGGSADCQLISIWQHGNLIEAANFNTALKYRHLTLNADGTISSTSIQTISGFLATICPPAIIVDSSDYPYILQCGYTPKVTKSSFNNGTWNTDGGYPFELNSTTSEYWAGSLIPLTNNKIYVAYSCGYFFDSEYFYGKLYNGSAWKTEEKISLQPQWDSLMHSIISIDDDVYFAYRADSTGTVKIMKRSYSTGSWILIGSFSSINEVQLFKDDDVLYFMGKSGDSIIYSYYDGSWAENKVFQIVGAFTSLSALAEVNSNMEIGYVYSTPYAPFYVKFDKIKLIEPPPYTPPSSSTPETMTTEEAPKEEKGEEPPPTVSISRFGIFGIIASMGVVGIAAIWKASMSGSRKRRAPPPKRLYGNKYQNRNVRHRRRVPHGFKA